MTAKDLSGICDLLLPSISILPSLFFVGRYLGKYSVQRFDNQLSTPILAGLMRKL